MSKINILTEEVIEEVCAESFKEKGLSPFDFIKSLNEKSEYIDIDIIDGYNTFIVNRNFSMDRNTIFHANNMNRYLDYKFHYDYYYNALSKRKRFTKWIKGVIDEEDLSYIKDYYNISSEKARIINKILNKKQKDELKDFKQNREQNFKLKN